MWEALVVIVAAALVVRRDLGLVLAVIIATLRVAVPVVYFAWYNDGSWYLLDDVTYWSDGQRILAVGYNPLTILLTPEGYEHIQEICGGHHILYTWWNVLAQYLFGQHYFAPVLLNVLVTFVTAFYVRRTMELIGFPPAYCRALEVFYLLHWEVIAWSSFVNVKDPIVQLLTVAELYCVTRFFRRRDWQSALGFVGVAQAFYFVRFYLPLVMLLGAALWMVWQWRNNLKFVLLPLALLGGYWALPIFQEHAAYLDPEAALTGTMRMLITPIPGRIEDYYSYLLVPSILHLVFLLPAAAGLVALWRASTPARLYLIYLVLIIELYAITEELQGPRQRFQVAFIFTWIQFHFLWVTFRSRQTATTRPAAAAPATTRAPLRPATRPAGAWA
jgi:hypothetical protein